MYLKIQCILIDIKPQFHAPFSNAPSEQQGTVASDKTLSFFPTSYTEAPRSTGAVPQHSRTSDSAGTSLLEVDMQN